MDGRTQSIALQQPRFCATDAAPLLAHLAHQPGLRSLHRPANLEDVFLKLTGRDLRD